MEVERIAREDKDLEHIKRLYIEAFPKKERDTVHHLLNRKIDGSDFVKFIDNGTVVGFAYLLRFNKILHILYFAIDKNLRSHGYGSLALKTLHDRYLDCVFIVDVEEPEGDELEKKINRINFYKHNGYQMTDISYDWHGVDYNIMSLGKITIKQFDEFWHHFEFKEDMGEFLYKMFKK